MGVRNPPFVSRTIIVCIMTPHELKVLSSDGPNVQILMSNFKKYGQRSRAPFWIGTRVPLSQALPQTSYYSGFTPDSDNMAV